MGKASSPLNPAHGGSWLCGDDRDRERMLDMEERVRPVRRRALAILAVALAAAGPWIGWLPVLVVVPSIVGFAAADRLIPAARRPENVMFATWVAAEVALAVAVALAGSTGASALSLLAVPILTLTSRFSMRGVLAGVAVALALTLAVAFGFDSHAVLAAPETLIAPIAVILCVAVLSAQLMRSDIEHRTDAVVDQLTGMLNRKALHARVHELTMQSEITREPIGLIVADLDHFKAINDTGGHNAGDRALQDVSSLIRAQLRAFDLAYRLGGEEFLILVPGSNLDQTTMLAERVREGVCSQEVADALHVTMSLGVTASVNGSSFDYNDLFDQADAALYRAKRSGRNRVCTAAEASFEPEPEPAPRAAAIA
jgi:diguanylate cyclase (GGDEF)-like protein